MAITIPDLQHQPVRQTELRHLVETARRTARQLIKDLCAVDMLVHDYPSPGRKTWAQAVQEHTARLQAVEAVLVDLTVIQQSLTIPKEQP